MTDLIISSTALILVVLTVRLFLKGHISLRLQYALWALVLIRLLLPFNMPGSPMSVLNALNTNEPLIVSGEADVPAPIDAASAAAEQPGDHSESPADSMPRTPATPFDWDSVLCLVWYTGIAAVGLCLIISNLSFARRLKRARCVFPVEDFRLKVFIVPNLPSPCLYGLLSPAVYITPDVAEDGVRLHHVLAHELCHFRHGDHIWSVLRSLCLALYWFNPLVWLAAAVSRRDGELACDEAAITRLGEASRMAYGRTLIGLTCQKRSALSMLSCATTMICSKKGLQERIALIAKKPKTTLLALIMILLVLGAAAGCTFTGAKPTVSAETAVTPEPGLTETAGSGENTGVTPDASAKYDTLYDGNNPLSKEELQKATRLRIINIDSLEFLRDAPNLTHLQVGTTDLRTYENLQAVSGDLSALKGLQKLMYVDLIDTNVTGDIGVLSTLPNLQVLYLDGSDVTGDLSTLSGLEKLRMLGLSSTGVTGALSALEGLANLEMIYLSGENITGELGALSGLSDLYSVYFYKTPNITGDIRVLQGRNLKEIHFTDTSITVDLGDLSLFPHLNTVELRNTNASGDLGTLSELPALQSIYLSGDGITGDLSALSGLSKLIYLDLSATPNITGSIGALKGLKLFSLTLDETNIAVDLSELGEFESLTGITLNSPKITGDIGAIRNLKLLSRVTLVSPNLSGDIGLLTRHINLSMLCLNSPSITGDVGALSGLKNLWYINLSDSSVSGDLGAVRDLEKLQYLILSDTKVAGDVSVLSALQNLTKIELTDTAVTGDIKAFEAGLP
jgi:beta-lactamase regulating signal transducer with metallopeptidase domain/Leucine-rich repeat (LRR) protein